jgi:hypothetical protein
MESPTLRQFVDTVATRMPVAPVETSCCEAASEPTCDPPPEATSHCSVMGAGGAKLAPVLHAPLKSRSVFETVGETEGAVTDDCGPPLLWLSDALIGDPGLAPATSAMPPAMSTPTPPVSVNEYDDGSLVPASRYQAWIRTFLAFELSVFGTAVQPAGAVRFRLFPAW